MSGWPTNPLDHEFQPYSCRQDELSILEGCPPGRKQNTGATTPGSLGGRQDEQLIPGVCMVA